MSTPSSRIYGGFVAFIILLASAFLLPGVFARGQNGLAGGAGAALSFLVLVGAGFVVAVFLLATTLRHRATLQNSARLAGFLPIPVLLLAGLSFWLELRQRSADPALQAPPAEPTPATAPTAAP
jgi:hypothetical protein